VGDILLGVFAGLTATSLEKLTAEIRKSNADDTTQMRMFALLQANCVGSIIFAMLHFITSLVRRQPAARTPGCLDARSLEPF
jgi:hypothetical protein